MEFQQRNSQRFGRGFTMIELMVGLAIGLLVVLVIVQTISVFDNQNRTTRGSADAQTNGSIALYTISRDLQEAGYPLMAYSTDSPLECTSAGTSSLLDPVVITEGGAPLWSDTLTVHYGSSAFGGTPSMIGAISGNNIVLQTNLGCQAGDAALISIGVSCAQTNVTALIGNTTVTVANPAGAVAGGKLACLGTWNAISYSVDASGNLVRTVNGNATPILSGVVNIQAQYGVAATANSNTVAQWVNASGTWATPSVADRNRIKAVRIAVVGRNDKMEPNAVSAACSSLNTANPSGLCAWTGSAGNDAPSINLAAANSDWARYRYRVFDTIIPLRNVIWSKDAL